MAKGCHNPSENLHFGCQNRTLVCISLTNDERETAKGNCNPLLCKIYYYADLLPSKYVISDTKVLL